MSGSSKAAGFVRYWPLITILVALGLVAEGYVQSEPLRGVISIACTGLAVYQWTIYTKRQEFSLPGLVLLTLATVSIWLALNVVRHYTYPRHSMEILRWYGLVVRVQAVMMWSIVVAVLVVSLWVIIKLAHWIESRVS
jgi:hypothetical protein